MVKSKDKNAETYDLKEYAYAKEVVRDLPRIISVYKKLLPVLYQYGQYQCVWPALQMIEEALVLAEIQHKYYKKIYLQKGKLTDEV